MPRSLFPHSTKNRSAYEAQKQRYIIDKFVKGGGEQTSPVAPITTQPDEPVRTQETATTSVEKELTFA